MTVSSNVMMTWVTSLLVVTMPRRLVATATAPSLPLSYTANITSVVGTSVLPNQPLDNSTRAYHYYVEAPHRYRIDTSDASGALYQSEIHLFTSGRRYLAYYGDDPTCLCDAGPKAYAPPLAIPSDAQRLGNDTRTSTWTWRVPIGSDGEGECYDTSTAVFVTGTLATYHDRTACDEQVIDEHQRWTSIDASIPDSRAFALPAFCEAAQCPHHPSRGACLYRRGDHQCRDS